MNNLFSQSRLAISDADTCFHCLEKLPKYGVVNLQEKAFCCHGCSAAYEFIQSNQLDDFYTHRERHTSLVTKGTNPKIGSLQDSNSRWGHLDDLDCSDVMRINKKRVVRFSIKGIYCSSCTWLIEKALNQQNKNFTVAIGLDNQTISLEAFSEQASFSQAAACIESLGYKLELLTADTSRNRGDARKQQFHRHLRRVVVAGFGLMQVMTYAVSEYLDWSSARIAMSADIERFFALLSMLVATVVVFYSGAPYLANAVRDIRNRVLGIDVPISIAIMGAYLPSALTVLSHGQGQLYFDSAVMFVFLISVGRLIEQGVKNKLLDFSPSLLSFLPDKVDVTRRDQDQESVLTIAVRDIEKDDRLIVHKGDILPCDALVLAGNGSIDNSLINGESQALLRSQNDRLLAGSKLLSGSLIVVATSSYHNSSLAALEQAINANTTAQLGIDSDQQRGRQFTKFVLLFSLFVAAFWFVYAPERLFEICLALLIAACPCAYTLADPIGRSRAAIRLRKIGIIVNDTSVLQRIQKVSNWMFDKTGTLTQGQPEITSIKVLDNLSEEACFKVATTLESKSSHVLASAFFRPGTYDHVVDFQESLGAGVFGTIGGTKYYFGKGVWVAKECGLAPGALTITGSQSESQSTVAVLAKQGTVLAVFHITDDLRADSIPVIERLKQDHDISILSGDNTAAVTAVAQSLGIKCTANLTAAQKADVVASEQVKGRIVAMVGDGINDSVAMTRADVSIGVLNSSLNFQLDTDLTLLNGDLRGLPRLEQISQQMTDINKQNKNWALVYNALVLPVAAAGFLTPWLAAIGMSLSSLLVLINALRIGGTSTLPKRRPSHKLKPLLKWS